MSFLTANTFLGKLGPKNKNCLSKVKFEYAELNSKVHFSYFQLEVIVLWKFRPKKEIVTWSWNLVARPIQTCWIQWLCSRFQFSTANTHFGKVFSRKSNLKFCTQTNSNVQNSKIMFTFPVFNGSTLFGWTWSKNPKLLI